MLATLRFELPDEEYDFKAAMSARESLRVIAEIDEYCRGQLKHGTPSEESKMILRTIREMVTPEIDGIIHGW